MDGYEILRLDGTGFDVQLRFTDPLRISTGIEPDLLLVQV